MEQLIELVGTLVRLQPTKDAPAMKALNAARETLQDAYITALAAGNAMLAAELMAAIESINGVLEEINKD